MVEPHSTKQYEDAVAWALESTGEVLAAGEEGFDEGVPDRETVEAMCRSLRVPTLTIHGDLDVCQHVDRGREFARITGGELLVMEGAGHLTPAREPRSISCCVTSWRGWRRESPVSRPLGYVDKDGVDIFYEIYDNEGPTIVLVPTTTIWNSRQWKAQIHDPSRHFRVVTFDGRGNGRSGKPTSEDAYLDEQLKDDILAVLDASETDQAVLACNAIPSPGSSIWRCGCPTGCRG